MDWQGNRTFLLSVGGGIVFLLIFRLAALGPIYSSTRSHRESVQKVRADLTSKYGSTGAPGEASVAAARAESADLNKAFAEAEKAVELGNAEAESFDALDKVADPGFYYKNTLQKVREALEKNRAQMPMPPGLGFTEDIPKEKEDISLQLFRLAVVRRVVEVACSAGASRVDSIKLLPVDVAGCPLRRRAPVEIEMTASLDSTMRFLHAISQPGQFLSLLNMEIASQAGGALTSRVTVAGLSKRLAKPLEPSEAIKRAPRGYR